MIRDLALTPLFGQPALLWGGLSTFLLLLTTATIGSLHIKGIIKISYKWHPALALTVLTLTTIHAIFGLSVFLNF